MRVLVLSDAQKRGSKGGKKTAERGPDYFKNIAAMRKTRAGGRPKKDDLHFHFEQAFQGHTGKVFSRREMIEIAKGIVPGSVLPTDHAEPDPKHTNQCNKCVDPTYRIFDTVVDGQGLPGKARYRVRDFKPFPR